MISTIPVMIILIINIKIEKLIFQIIGVILLSWSFCIITKADLELIKNLDFNKDIYL